MTSFLTSLQEIAAAVLETVGEVINTIMGNPMLLFTVGFLFLGGAIGIFGRLLSRR